MKPRYRLYFIGGRTISVYWLKELAENNDKLYAKNGMLCVKLGMRPTSTIGPIAFYPNFPCPFLSTQSTQQYRPVFRRSISICCPEVGKEFQ